MPNADRSDGLTTKYGTTTIGRIETRGGIVVTSTLDDGVNDSWPDATLTAVADAKRRAVLRTLARADTDLDVPTLVDRVAGQIPGDGSADEHRRQLHSTLRHVHLPKLAACGLIEYDPDSGRVRHVHHDLTEDLLAAVDASG